MVLYIYLTILFINFRYDILVLNDCSIDYIGTNLNCFQREYIWQICPSYDLINSKIIKKKNLKEGGVKGSWNIYDLGGGKVNPVVDEG